MQFHTENENIDVHIYSRVFLTIIILLFMQYILYCMTKLYITNDDSSQAPFVQSISLHHVTSTLRVGMLKQKLLLLHS